MSKVAGTKAEKPALFHYDAISRELIYGIKYRNILSPISWIAEQYISAIPPEIDIITWIPASPSQQQKRGYDQCKLLAKAISLRSTIPYIQLLGRKLDTPQTHRKDSRLLGPKLYVKPKNISSIQEGKRVLLIDDVVTTGTSMRLGKNILEASANLSVYTLGIAIVGSIASSSFSQAPPIQSTPTEAPIKTEALMNLSLKSV